MKSVRIVCSIILLGFLGSAEAFTGFFVGKTSERLFSRSSQIVIARNGSRTAVTLFSNYRGKSGEFAFLIPVPAVLNEAQISIGEPEVLRRLESFTAPRLIEHTDPDPCEQREAEEKSAIIAGLPPGISHGSAEEEALASGEYEVLTLTEQESADVSGWLKKNGYQLPKDALAAIKTAQSSGMKFFVVKVTLSEPDPSRYQHLKPIQFAFESEQFQLPLGLGMAGAETEQDLTLYLISRRGRVLPVERPLIPLPTGAQVPEFIKNKFSSFYDSVLAEVFKKEKNKPLVLEYAWNMGWCDPCAADPLSSEELRRLGVFWLDEGQSTRKSQMIWPPGGGPVEAFVTRVHFHASRDQQTANLSFKESKNGESFQAKYTVRHPWIPSQRACAQASKYMAQTKGRRENEAQTLVGLTGWPIEDVYKHMGAQSALLDQQRKWYEKIFK